MDMVWNWGRAGLLGNGIGTARNRSEDEAKGKGIGRIWQGIERFWDMQGIRGDGRE